MSVLAFYFRFPGENRPAELLAMFDAPQSGLIYRGLACCTASASGMRTSGDGHLAAALHMPTMNRVAEHAEDKREIDG